MKRMPKFSWCLYLLFTVFIASCGGEDTNGGTSISTGSAKQEVSGTISPPAGVKADSFSITSLGATSSVTSRGGYSTKVYQDGVAALIATQKGKSFGLINIVASSSPATALPARIAAASVTSSNSAIPLNSKTTAVSMVFITPYFLTNNAVKATKIISIIEADPKVDTLATVINGVFTSADPLSDPNLQQALNDAIQSVWTTVKNIEIVTATPVRSSSVKTINLPNTTNLALKSSSVISSTPYSSDQDYVNIISTQNGTAYDLRTESRNLGSVDWFSEVMKLDVSQFGSFSDFQDKQLNNRTIYQGERQELAGRLSAPAKSIFRYADLLTIGTDYISRILFGEENPAKVSISATEDGVYLLRSYSGSFGTLVDLSEKNFVRKEVPNGSMMDTSALALNTVTLSLDMASIFVDVNYIENDIIEVCISSGIDLAKKEAGTILSDTSPSFNSLIYLFQKVFMAVFKSLASNDTVSSLSGRVFESGIKSIVDVPGKISSAGEAADRFSQMLTSATPLETTLIIVGNPFPAVATYAISGRVTVNNIGLAGVIVSLNGSNSEFTLTDINGDYVFNDSANGTYSITAEKSGYNFTPFSINSIVVNGSGVFNQNFSANAIQTTYSMNGTIHYASNSGPALSGVTVSIAGKTSTTSNTGTFFITGIPAGIYSFSVYKSGYDTYTNPAYHIGSNQTNLNFYVTQPVNTYSMSGTIHAFSNTGPALSNATVSIAGRSAITSSTGTFLINDIPAGTYEFSVSRFGYDTFTNPAYYIGTNQTSRSFYLNASSPFGALAINFTTLSAGISAGYSLVESAGERALQECGYGCSIIFSYSKGTCAAFASGNNSYGASVRDTLSEATAGAISNCSIVDTGCTLKLWGCN